MEPIFMLMVLVSIPAIIYFWIVISDRKQADRIRNHKRNCDCMDCWEQKSPHA